VYDVRLYYIVDGHFFGIDHRCTATDTRLSEPSVLLSQINESSATMLPLSLLTAAQNKPMLVELKNGETFNGHLVNCDNFMNITLREVYQTSADGDRFWKLKECYIRGSTIKYLRVPDTLLDAVKEEQARAREVGRSARGGPGPGSGSRGMPSSLFFLFLIVILPCRPFTITPRPTIAVYVPRSPQYDRMHVHCARRTRGTDERTWQCPRDGSSWRSQG
jgi:U6 snRNA-associated Sm-like protein LSm4